MIARGAPFDVLQQYMQDAQLVFGTDASLGDILSQGGAIPQGASVENIVRDGGALSTESPAQHPEMMPGQQQWQDPRLATNLPLAKLREQEQRMLSPVQPPDPDALGDLGAGVAAAGTAAATGGLSVPLQVGATTLATVLGSVAGDTAVRASREGPMTKQEWGEIAGNAGWRGALNATFDVATRGLARMFGFLRGAKPTVRQKTAMQHAAATKVAETGFKLPLSAEDVAERTVGARIARVVRRFTVTGAVRAQQQGRVVARYMDQHLRTLKQNPQGAVKDPSNVVDYVADWAAKHMPNSRLALGVGEEGAGFDTAENYIRQLFNPKNASALQRMQRTSPELFDDATAAWLTDAIKRHETEELTGGFMTVNGANFRHWFEENLDLIREVFSPEQVRAWDGFTAYMAFATALAKRGFPVDDAVETAATASGAPALGGLLALAGVDPLLGGAGAEGAGTVLGWALSKPGNPIFQLFTQPFSDTAPAFAEGVRMARDVAQGVVQSEPWVAKPRGQGRVKREPRPGDIRYTAPSFPPRGR